MIHTAAKLVTWVVGDQMTVGGAAATFSRRQSVDPICVDHCIGAHAIWCGCCSYSQGGGSVDGFLFCRCAPPPSNLFLLISSNASAIQVVKILWLKKAHSFTLHFHNTLTLFFLHHAGVHLYLVWLPQMTTLMATDWQASLLLRPLMVICPMGWIGSNLCSLSKGPGPPTGFSQLGTRVFVGALSGVLSLHLAQHPSLCCLFIHHHTTPPSKHHHTLWKEGIQSTARWQGTED